MNQINQKLTLSGTTATLVMKAIRDGKNRRQIELGFGDLLANLLSERKISNKQFGKQNRIVDQIISGYEAYGEEFIQGVTAKIEAGTDGWGDEE